MKIKYDISATVLGGQKDAKDIPIYTPVRNLEFKMKKSESPSEKEKNLEVKMKKGGQSENKKCGGQIKMK